MVDTQTPAWMPSLTLPSLAYLFYKMEMVITRVSTSWGGWEDAGSLPTHGKDSACMVPVSGTQRWAAVTIWGSGPVRVQPGPHSRPLLQDLTQPPKTSSFTLATGLLFSQNE